MDGYPSHLAPSFEESGAVATPFPEWWSIVKNAFANVPEEVARDWLHRHWSHSPFGWLPSRDYTFRCVDWSSDRLSEIRSGWSDFSKDPSENIGHGRYLVEENLRQHRYELINYIVDNRTFPVAPIVLDNSDGHLGSIAGAHFDFPAAHILIEGHLRFNIASYLASVGRLNSVVPFWLMERVDNAGAGRVFLR